MITEALTTQLAFVDFTVQGNLDGISQDLSLRSASEGGNTINWVFGHMIHARSGMLRLLGQEPLVEDSHGKLYGRGSAAMAPGSDCVPLVPHTVSSHLGLKQPFLV